MQINAKMLLQLKKKEHKAVPAFNVSSLETLRAVFLAAQACQSPIIIETSKGESEYLTPELLAKICAILADEFNVDYVLHLDRAQTLDWIKRCLDAGYNSVTAESLDPTKKMSIESTIEIVQLAKSYHAQVEGSVEVVPIRYYQDNQQKHLFITDPKEAVDFVTATGIDSLVVSIGTQSGKFKEIKNLRFEVLESINNKLPEMPFVLHGGSFLEPQVCQKAISLGIAKINVNAELRLAFTNKLKANIQANPAEYAPYRLLAGTIAEIKKVAINKILLFSNQ